MYLERGDLTPSPRSGPDWYKEDVRSGYVTKFQPKKHEGKSEHFWRNFSIFQERAAGRESSPLPLSIAMPGYTAQNSCGHLAACIMRKPALKVKGKSNGENF